MPGKKNLRHSDVKKKTDLQNSRSQDETINFPQSSSLLKELLLDLGLKDTAKTLEEETRRRLQLLPETTNNNNNINRIGNSVDNTNSIENETINNSSNGVNNQSNLNIKESGNGNSSINVVKKESEAEIQNEEFLNLNLEKITLFKALAYRSSGGNNEITNLGILHDLSYMVFNPLRWATTTGSDNSEEEIILTPILRKLFNVFMKNNNNNNNSSETKSEEEKQSSQLLINIPPIWVSLLEVFFAHVEVLWAQLRLVEAVTRADFISNGWFLQRSYILDRLSQLQEKLQQLLLEAHQLENAMNNGELLCNPGENEKNEIESSNSSKSNITFNSLHINEATTVSGIKMSNSIINIFCLGAPNLRNSIEEVSSWILTQCSRCTEINSLNESSFEREREPFPVKEEQAGKSNNNNNNNKDEKEEHLSLREPWKLFMGAVRKAALMGSEENSDNNSHNNNNNHYHHHHNLESEPFLLVDFKLCWAQTIHRIQMFAWIIGSLADFSDLLLNNFHTPKEIRGRKSIESQTSKGNDIIKRVPVSVNAAIGFWYQNCAGQLNDLLNFNSSNFVESSETNSIQQEDNELEHDSNIKKTHYRRLPLRKNELTEDDKIIGNSLVYSFKKAANELLASKPEIVESFSLPLVNNDLLQQKSLKFSISKNGTNGVTQSRLYNNNNNYYYYGSDIHLTLLSALATGKQQQGLKSRNPQHITLYRLLRRAFRSPRILLDLQDDNVPVDLQLKALEYFTTHVLLPHSSIKTGIFKGLPRRKSNERNRRTNIVNEPISVRTNEDESTILTEATTIISSTHQRRSSEGIGIRVEPTEVNEEAGEPVEPSIHRQVLALVRDLIRIPRDNIRSEEDTAIDSDEDGASSTGNYNFDRSGDEVFNEVQIVAITPCGSLLAILTTKGRLIVFALRSTEGKASQMMTGEQVQGLFCEKLVLDTNLIKEPKDSRWYEQLASFLSFSPCGRFILCSIQYAPTSVPEGDEMNRSYHETTGKVFIYSLHCTEEIKSNMSASTTSNSDNNNNNNTEYNRLYEAFRIHNSLITVARWLDPRFWQYKKRINLRSTDEKTPLWKQEAYRRLSELQCLSSGRDNKILRWSPADGKIIQSISTMPVYDILVSPLMQAFYTINQYGQLSMYDAWNEHNIETATENIIGVSQRGLPTSLSILRSPTDTREDNSLPKSVGPRSDGEIQNDFFVGARIICFDRRHVAQGGSEHEPITKRISRVAREKGIPAGTERRESDRLGRSILHQVLHQEEANLVSHSQPILEPSSGSENEEEDIERIRNQRPSYRSNDVNNLINPISYLRLNQNNYEEKNSYSHMSYKGSKKYDQTAVSGDVILYKSGSRLVFDEVSQALCHTAGIWPTIQESRYSPPPQPYHLLSMTASGYPIYNDDESDEVLTCHRCRFHERVAYSPRRSSTCNYYTDIYKLRGKKRRSSTVSNGDNSTTTTTTSSSSSFNEVKNKIKRHSSMCVCRGSHNRIILPPTARNGRYLCIMASVGPNRATVQHDRPLEFRAGIYACVVFDVLFGNVIRVIPVCSTLPRTNLTMNGVLLSHSQTKRAPIFMLPCSVTVVQKQQEQKQEEVKQEYQSFLFHSVSGKHNMGVKKSEKSVLNSFMQGNEKNNELEEEEEKDDKDEENDKDLYNNKNSNEEDVTVLVAVGGLHSTTYIFDALTGSRVKVIDLKKQKVNLPGAINNIETRPPSKRARCSYVSLSKLHSDNKNSNLGRERDDDNNNNNNSSSSNDEDEYYDDDDEYEYEEDKNSISINSPLQYSENNFGRQRQILIRQLADKYGMNALLKAATDMLGVVPHSLYPFSVKLPEGSNNNNNNNRNSINSPHKKQQSMGNYSNSFHSKEESLLNSSALSSYRSFMDQLLFVAKGIHSGRGDSSVNSTQHQESLTGGNNIIGHDVPFALVSYEELRRVLISAVADKDKDNLNENEKDNDNEIASPMRTSAAARKTKRFRCGVVNSVALFYDNVKGGVYVFSGDEYGALYMAGGLLSN